LCRLRPDASLTGVRGIRRHLSFANVAALLALFIALSSGAYAAINIPRNAIDAKAIQANAVGVSELKAASVTSKKLAQKGTEALKALPTKCQKSKAATQMQADKAGIKQFKCVPDTGEAPVGVQPCVEKARAADMCLDVPGLPEDDEFKVVPRGLPFCYGDAQAGSSCLDTSQGLGPDSVVRGVIGHLGPLQPDSTYHAYASLPFPSYDVLGDIQVRVSNSPDDPGNTCNGSYVDPTAPASGIVCIYPVQSPGVESLTGEGFEIGAASAYGFSVQLDTASAPLPNPAGFEAAWAFRGRTPPVLSP
jgi:hypothetical protein